MTQFTTFSLDPELIFNNPVPGVSVIHLGNVVAFTDGKICVPFAISDYNSNDRVRDILLVMDPVNITSVNYILENQKMCREAALLPEGGMIACSYRELKYFDMFIKFREHFNDILDSAFDLVEKSYLVMRQVKSVKRLRSIKFANREAVIAGANAVLVSFVVDKNRISLLIYKEVTKINISDLVALILRWMSR